MDKYIIQPLQEKDFDGFVKMDILCILLVVYYLSN